MPQYVPDAGSGTAMQITDEVTQATDTTRWKSETSEFFSQRTLGRADKPMHKFMKQVITSPKFDATMGVVILMNSVCIGVEQTLQLQQQDTFVIELLDKFYLTLYTLELILRFFVFGIRALSDHWVKFDALLVSMGVLTTFILTPVFGSVDQLGPLLVLRTARLLRLVRMVRLLVKFKELWMLTRGLLNSATTMGHTVTLLVMILYMFSCIGVEVVTKHTLAHTDPEFQRIVATYFPGPIRTMLTLVQFTTMDSISAIYSPLVAKDWRLAFYFMTLVIVISILLLNLITAIVVNKAMEQASQDKDALSAYELGKRRKLMKQLREMFMRLDEDNSGQVTREELANITDHDKQLLSRLLGTGDPIVVFDDCDCDGSGEVDIEEFCDGIWKAVTSDVPAEVRRIEKQVSLMWAHFKAFETMQQRLEKMMDEVQRDIRYTVELNNSRYWTQPSPAPSPKIATPPLQDWTFRGLELREVNEVHAAEKKETQEPVREYFPAITGCLNPNSSSPSLKFEMKHVDQKCSAHADLQNAYGHVHLCHQEGINGLDTKLSEMESKSPIKKSKGRASKAVGSECVKEVQKDLLSTKIASLLDLGKVVESDVPASSQESCNFETAWCADDFLVHDVASESPATHAQNQREV